jgi:hypothetical protein
MGAQARRAQGQQQRRAARAIIGLDQRDCDRCALERRRRLACRQAPKRRAARQNIPPCGIIEGPTHPA